jgi:two-component system alkaline phosphatase synthesis response regulator PhoP
MSTILVIEDDPKMQAGLRDNLEFEGYTVRTEGSGTGGLKVWMENAFDCVILDVMLPGMNGLDVLRQLRRTTRVPVVMLSAIGDESDRIAGLEVGADDYLPKTFSTRELLARLRAVLALGQGAEAAQRRQRRYGGL